MDPGYLFAIYKSPDLSTWQRIPGGAMKACSGQALNSTPPGTRDADGGQVCWGRDWQWAPECYYNAKTKWYFLFFSARLRSDLTKDTFRYEKYEEPSKLGVAVSRSAQGPFEEIQPRWIDYYPFDPHYHDVNLIMDEEQKKPPNTKEIGSSAPQGTYIPSIDPNVYFDENGKDIYLYYSRNAYRNWNWDETLSKYIEESNILGTQLQNSWWNDPEAKTMPEIVSDQKDKYKSQAKPLPANISAYNATGEIGKPPRMDGWKTLISYGADPQEW